MNRGLRLADDACRYRPLNELRLAKEIDPAVGLTVPCFEPNHWTPPAGNRHVPVSAFIRLTNLLIAVSAHGIIGS